MRATRAILIAPAVVALIAISGCAGMRLDHYHFAGDEVTHESTFDRIPEYVRQLEHVSLEEGSLHSRAPVGGAAHWVIPDAVSRHSLVSFRLKLGSDVNPGHPSSHINVLQRHPPHRRLVVNFDTEWGTGYFWHTATKNGNGEVSPRSLSANTWYAVDLLLDGDTMTVFVGGARLGRVPIADDLPERGAFVVECHNELWLDDLRIRDYDGYEIDKDR